MSKCTKSLKIKKIGILMLVLFIVLSVPTSAVYTSGDLDTNRYYSPLRFDFEILGTTAQLTPTISYGSGLSLTDITDEVATQRNSVVTSIKRSNFGVSTVGQTCVDVSYRLSFDVSESLDDFTIRITASGGIYDFVKYGIPQISIPTGYTVSASVSYNVRFTQSQSNTDNITDYVQYNATYQQNDIFPLLRNYYLVNGDSFDIVGGIIVNDYVVDLQFVSQASSGDIKYGDAGYYLWDTVINYEDTNFGELLGTGDQYLSCDGVRLIGSTNGVVDTVDVLGIYFTSENDPYFDMGYELAPDQSVLVYNFSEGEWYGATSDDDGIVVDVITAEQMRLLHFTVPFVDAFDLSSLDSSDPDQANVVRLFRLFLFSQSTVYSDNPLQTVTNSDGFTYSFTDGDGGMYLHYYADRMLDEEFSQTIADYYGFAYSAGFSVGDGGFTRDYSGWIASAVSGFTSLQIFPNFSIGGVLGVIVSLCLLILFLKFFAGG